MMFGRRFRYIGRTRSLCRIPGRSRGGWRARGLNALRQIAQLPWFVKNLAVKVLLTLRLGGLIKRVTGRVPEWPY